MDRKWGTRRLPGKLTNQLTERKGGRRKRRLEQKVRHKEAEK